MKKILFIAGLFLLFCAGSYASSKQGQKKEVTMKKALLADKIKGGWAAKTIGCTYGGPVEFLHNGTMIQDYTPIQWSKYRVKHYFDTFPGLNDDIYVDIVFVNVFERLGLEAPADSFAISFANAGFPLWHANQVAKYNIKQGIMPPMSGHWLNNPHADDIDFQIEADFAGLMAPGMPNTSSDFCDRVGHIFTYGDGWYGGVFVGALYSMAFVYDDVEAVVKEALKTIPAQSEFYQCVDDVIKWHAQFPDDWKRTWFECQKKWTSEVGCPDGVFAPFDIDAKINSAYVAMGLLYGQKDFFRTIDIAARCGQDSDCNAATAAGILGVVLGYENIPEMWRESLYEVSDLSFAYTDVSLNKLYDLSLGQALKVIKQQGGKVKGDDVVIKLQQPVAVRYEKAFEGHFPVEKRPINGSLKDELKYTFCGNGFVQKGSVLCEDKSYVAKVELYIDGKLVETANLPVANSTSIDDRRVDLFHRYQLEDKEHEVTLKCLNARDDAQIYVGDVLIYASQPRESHLLTK